MEDLDVSAAMTNPNASFWKSKRVLITGHTGFKGAWLTWWLCKLGAEVTGVALEPATSPSLFSALNLQECLHHHIGDVSDEAVLVHLVQKTQPEIVFHLAAQALVRDSYERTIETFSTNVMGTVHLLDALRAANSCVAAIMVTTDKVYHNNEWAWPYREQDRLGGHDPYSASKAASEIVIESYRKSFLASKGIAVASARAGNVIGGGDWSKDRLIPDAVRAWSVGQPLEIRSPQSIRPWQHVLEPLCAYLRLAEQLAVRPELAGAYNFGPLASEAANVKHVTELARDSFGQGKLEFAQAPPVLHEAQLLSLDVSKAKVMLDITPRLSLKQTIQMTMSWYQGFLANQDAQSLCEKDLLTYGKVES
jgi:CDP-glucose 4,6-dehydratase